MKVTPSQLKRADYPQQHHFLKFMFDNDIEYDRFDIEYAALKKDGLSAFGMACKISDDTVLFCRHKPVLINQSKPTPKFCSEIQYSVKKMTTEEYNQFFRKIDLVELTSLEMLADKIL